MQNNMTATKENIVASDQQEALLQRKIESGANKRGFCSGK